MKYTGNQSNATIGHNLSYAPEMIIAKSTTVAQNWAVYHKDVGNQYWLQLNSDSARITEAIWQNTTPTNSVFSLNGNVIINKSSSTNIAYCFHSVAGFSKVGSYTGNGNATGPIITTNFEPGFLMIKAITAAGESWVIYDSARNTSNPRNCQIRPNTNGAEGCSSDNIDFNSTNFQLKSSWPGFNGNNSTYMYLAIKEN